MQLPISDLVDDKNPIFVEAKRNVDLLAGWMKTH
ncbi:hypothetical protein KIPB_012350, partial [Kipferlia bialata]|eukprot:g12350.t1